MTGKTLLIALSPLLALPASCAAASTGENSDAMETQADAPFLIEEAGTFSEPWAMDWAEGTDVLLVTEKKGAIRLRAPDGTIHAVSGAPEVDYGGQGGLGDIRFAPGQAAAPLSGRTLYLSWAEAGPGGTRGAAVGRATLVCAEGFSCALEKLSVIWRQSPKVTGRGHYSHRIAFSPDGQYLFIASGDRQKLDPAQDTGNTLGTIVRLLPDGTPAPGNPLADRGSPSDEIWSWGHRNILGLRFDASGQLWDLEHGPAGGDELNRVAKGANYGWPVVSNGRHYSGEAIPDHATRPDFAKPAISWNPVIAPGDMLFYSGAAFPAWQGQALIAAMKPAALVVVQTKGNSASETQRWPMPHRIRSISQGPDGSVWLLEDGKNLPESRLLRLVPRGDAEDSAP